MGLHKVAKTVINGSEGDTEYTFSFDLFGLILSKHSILKRSIDQKLELILVYIAISTKPWSINAI